MSRSAVLTLERAKRGPTRAEIQSAAERVRQQAEDLAVRQGVAETVSLDIARGQQFIQPKQGRGERAKPVFRVDGPRLLRNSGAITEAEYGAVERAGKLYRNLFHKGSCRSALNDSPRGSGGLSAVDARLTDMRALIVLKEKAFGDHSRLVAVFNQFCGEGMRPSEMNYNGLSVQRLRAECIAVAGLLAVYYGSV
jgi:hypothetical protein